MLKLFKYLKRILRMLMAFHEGDPTQFPLMAGIAGTPLTLDQLEQAGEVATDTAMAPTMKEVKKLLGRVGSSSDFKNRAEAMLAEWRDRPDDKARASEVEELLLVLRDVDYRTTATGGLDDRDRAAAEMSLQHAVWANDRVAVEILSRALGLTTPPSW